MREPSGAGGAKNEGGNACEEGKSAAGSPKSGRSSCRLSSAAAGRGVEGLCIDFCFAQKRAASGAGASDPGGGGRTGRVTVGGGIDAAHFRFDPRFDARVD